MQVDSLPLIGIHSSCTQQRNLSWGEGEMKISVQWKMLSTVYTGKQEMWRRRGERGRKAKQDLQLELERCSNIYANFGAGIFSC